MYDLIYCDPPWQYGNTVSNGAAQNHYGTMSLNDLMRLPVIDIANENSVLVMWYTGNFNSESQQLAKAWGFDVRTMKGLTWVKLNQLAESHINKALVDGQIDNFYDLLDILNAQTRLNGGNYTRANTEDALIAVRGKGLERVNAAVKQVVYAPIGRHSQKPWEARRRIELLYGDVKRIELFSREDIPGWDTWGDQCPTNSIELKPASFINGVVKER